MGNAAGSIRWSQVLLGGLLVALGDTVFATCLWFGWTAAGLVKLFQTIAVGWLGQASYAGGMQSAAIGAASHLFIACMYVLVYALAARRMPALLRHPLRDGIGYGVLLYLVMNFVVLPLSRVGRTPSFAHLDWIGLSVLAHMVFGVVCVLFARRALRR